MNFLKGCVLAVACLCLISGAECADEYRTVVDSRGVQVQVPAEIERVVTVSDGIIESVLFVLGKEDKIIGVGSSGIQMVFNYTYPSVGEETYEYQDGMNPVTYLNPQIRELPVIMRSGVINYEALAGLNPDLVILHVGAWLPSMEDEEVQKMIRTIEALEIPVFVLEATQYLDDPDHSTISDEIRVLGAVFEKENKADEIADYIESQTQVVFERTEDVPDVERPTVLRFDAYPTIREAGGAGAVRGIDRVDSYLIEEIVHAKNAYQNTGNPTVSTEQLLALDPDVIILGTAGGYHPPEELYSAPYYQNAGELSAVKNRRVYSLPWTSGNCARSLEYPIAVMIIAKAAYPELFTDIKVHEWVLEFYQNVYGVDEETAIGLRSAQWLDWTVEEDF
jgi:iron complex transport system substrate-binding protein